MPRHNLARKFRVPAWRLPVFLRYYPRTERYRPRACVSGCDLGAPCWGSAHSWGVHA